MTPETVMTVGRQALEITTLLAGPLLISSLVVGLIIAMFQAATQINEMTLTFIPKVATIAVVLMVAGPWLLKSLMTFTVRLIQNIPSMIG
ncbi:flagellar biosynthesis protein FliQ [Thiohalobacter sp. IOR34]|uniref:flagellar biosynthesis protein FliQ n=1 Tax=Thiohalobacter sp. IOR34 TaxID=3057176 RepID=UPI0025B0D711|nr:flagellar biosynthesis protein FliQ [Thiohalobacter sp. IOR34]WJW74564.1 flagellar biosynthesis protein FliQ [Thiohalobacter sp. IOR34]